MTGTLWIAVNVFREAVRDKVLYNLVLFAILMIAASYLVGQLTAGQDIKIIKDLGLTAIAVFGLFIAVFIGIGLVSKEIERRSIYSLLSKPVRRSQLVIAKFAGLTLTLAVNLAAMAIALYAVLAMMARLHPAAAAASEASAIDPKLLAAIAMIFVELTLVTAIALFLSTFAEPMVAASLSFAIYVVGHFSSDLRNFRDVVDSAVAARVANGLYWVLPNLAQFDIKADVVHGYPISFRASVLSVGYAALYSAMLLLVATLVFSRRDFK